MEKDIATGGWCFYSFQATKFRRLEQVKVFNSAEVLLKETAPDGTTKVKKKTNKTLFGGSVKAGPFQRQDATYDVILTDAIRKFKYKFSCFPTDMNWVLTYVDNRKADVAPNGEPLTLLRMQQCLRDHYSQLKLYVYTCIQLTCKHKET